MESYRNKFLDAIELIAEISYVMYENRQNEMGDQVDGIASEKDMFMDASREFLLHLYLNDEEVDECNVRREQCWEDEDPIKCKKNLDDEFKKRVSERMRSRTNISDLTKEMYKATISSVLYIINNFSKHTGLPDVQCKNDFKQQCTWIRIPDVLDCDYINLGIGNPDSVPGHQPHLSNEVNDEGEGEVETNTFPVLDSIPVETMVVNEIKKVTEYE
ncbi:hypothetical protein CDAR_565081 [Caerostris darwini]|uniref:PIR Superfamily Protein n=1 Tax=Caerostris darwini TaxID=1538125 RepID=A0AAV4Q9G8_9ARAC|nr:hypothetical protein CDAR_565081 [Caerostris darwini]